MTASFIQEFEQKHAAYRVTPESLPTPNLTKVPDLRKSPIWTTSSATLVLHPGERTREGSGRFRTTSRYELHGTSGALLSSGESVLASADLKDPDLQPSIRIAFDQTSRRILVVEEHSWSVERILVLAMDGRQEPARYVRIPSRRSLEPFDHYEIVAFSGGRLYIKQDGAAFAFPLDALQPYTDLDYSIGVTTPIYEDQQVVTTKGLPAASHRPDDGSTLDRGYQAPTRQPVAAHLR